MIPHDSIFPQETAADKPEEACGVFGVYAPGQDVAKLTYFGIYALQHRGQESAGIATMTTETMHHYKDMGLVSQVFKPEILEELGGNWAIGHTRYSTTGSSRRVNAQPATVDTRLGAVRRGCALRNADRRQERDLLPGGRERCRQGQRRGREFYR